MSIALLYGILGGSAVGTLIALFLTWVGVFAPASYCDRRNLDGGVCLFFATILGVPGVFGILWSAASIWGFK